MVVNLRELVSFERGCGLSTAVEALVELTAQQDFILQTQVRLLRILRGN